VVAAFRDRKDGQVKIFQITAPEGFDWVLPINEQDFDALRFDGRSRQASWVPVKMRRVVADERGRPLAESDFPSCSGGDMLLLRQHAVDALGDLLGACGELLPLECVGRAPLWALNVTTLLDALDESRSKLLRMPESGEILRVKVPFFRPEAVAEAQLFKLSRMPRGLIYATETFVQRVKSLPLRGIDFKQVWAPD
jgi:hypothetical protein